MPEDIVGRIVRLPGYGTYQHEFDEERSEPSVWVRQVGTAPSFTCGGCGVGWASTSPRQARP